MSIEARRPYALQGVYARPTATVTIPVPLITWPNSGSPRLGDLKLEIDKLDGSIACAHDQYEEKCLRIASPAAEGANA